MNKYKIVYMTRPNGWGKSWQLWQQYRYYEHDKWIYSWRLCCQGNVDVVFTALEKRLKKEKLEVVA